MASRSRLNSDQSRSSVFKPQSATNIPAALETAADQIIHICKKPVLFRRPQETKLLIDSLRNIKFFKEQFNEHYEGMLEDVAENAKLHFYNKHEIIIKQDTFGDTFYIIIKGQAKVVKRVLTNIGQTTTKKGKKKEQYHEQIKEIMVLNDGDYFGELALLERKPRGADVIAVTECNVLGLDKESFDRIMATKTKRQFLHLLNKLSQNSILKEISKNTVKALFMIMERKVYNFGDIVYKFGDKGNSLYFILEGEFKMTSIVFKDKQINFGNDKELFKREVEICVVGQNETLGLEEFLDEENRKWKAICQSQISIVYKLNRIDYKRIEQKYPDIVEAISKIISEKKKYYDEWKMKHVIPGENQDDKEQSIEEKFDFNIYSERAKQLKAIIMKDKDMSFISRDQVTINDDKEIMLRYCPFFQLGIKKATPFLVNTIETIQQRRIKSAGYRTVLSNSTPNLLKKTRPITGQSKEPENGQIILFDSFQKNKNFESLPTATQNLQLTTQGFEEVQKKSNLFSPKGNQQVSPDKPKKLVVKKIVKNYNTALQNKMMAFMNLTPNKISEMVIQQRLNKEEYKNKKLYIKQYPNKNVEEMKNRIQSAASNQHQKNISSQRFQIHQFRKGTSSSRNLLTTQNTIPTSGGECSRIHSTKSYSAIQIDTSALPLKYQAELINKKFQKKNNIISPISTFLNKNKFREKQISTLF